MTTNKDKDKDTCPDDQCDWVYDHKQTKIIDVSGGRVTQIEVDVCSKCGDTRAIWNTVNEL